MGYVVPMHLFLPPAVKLSVVEKNVGIFARVSIFRRLSHPAHVLDRLLLENHHERLLPIHTFLGLAGHIHIQQQGFRRATRIIMVDSS